MCSQLLFHRYYFHSKKILSCFLEGPIFFFYHFFLFLIFFLLCLLLPLYILIYNLLNHISKASYNRTYIRVYCVICFYRDHLLLTEKQWNPCMMQLLHKILVSLTGSSGGLKQRYFKY